MGEFCLASESEADEENLKTRLSLAYAHGRRYFWEADECARCTARGDRESKRMPWKESVLVMEVSVVRGFFFN